MNSMTIHKVANGWTVHVAYDLNEKVKHETYVARNQAELLELVTKFS